MPYLPLQQIHPDVILGMWRVEESEAYFLSRLNIYENEERILESITHPDKRLEWLSSRLCLKRLLHISHKVESLNENTGKPYLSDNSFNISYTHSNLYSGAIASDKTAVAMDLENLEKERNLETRRMFMSKDEHVLFDESGQDTRLFFLIWSAKETLYKIYGKQGIAFRDNLSIVPPSTGLEQKGQVKGIIRENGFEKEYDVHYQFFPDILLTFTYDSDRL